MPGPTKRKEKKPKEKKETQRQRHRRELAEQHKRSEWIPIEGLKKEES